MASAFLDVMDAHVSAKKAVPYSQCLDRLRSIVCANSGNTHGVRLGGSNYVNGEPWTAMSLILQSMPAELCATESRVDAVCDICTNETAGDCDACAKSKAIFGGLHIACVCMLL